MRTRFFFFVLCCIPGWVGAVGLPYWAKVQRDDISGFTVKDSAVSWKELPCSDSSRIVHAPLHTVWKGAETGPAVPVRSYLIALPGPQTPQVEVLAMGSRTVAPPCGMNDVNGLQLPHNGSELWSEDGAPRIGKPMLRDGLWQVWIGVPLLRGRAGHWEAVHSWQLLVTFNTVPTVLKRGNLGRRLETQISNPLGATYFLQGRDKAAKRLSRSAITEKNWLARIAVGDRDHSTFLEDGFYRLSFAEIRRALQAVGRERELEGLSLRNLRLFAGPQDTLTHALATNLVMPGNYQEIPIQILDHNGLNDVNSNGIFDEGDTIVFFGQGTSFWKKNTDADSASRALVPYFFSSNPFSFVNYYYLAVDLSGDGLRLSSLPPPSGQGQVLTELPRFVRSEKDLLLRDSYFGIFATGWEDKSGREWFWIWSDNTDTTIISESTLQNSAMASPLGNVGNNAIWHLDLLPHRSAHASMTETNGSVFIYRQRSNLTLSRESFYLRMSSINAALRVNGALATNRNSIQQGAGLIWESPLLNNGNRMEISLAPNGNHFDRFNGLTMQYTWQPQWVAGGEWILPGFSAGRIRIPIGGNTQDLMALRVEQGLPRGWVTLAQGALEDSIATDSNTKWFLYRHGEFRTGAVVEGLTPPPPQVLQNLQQIPSDGTEYLIIVADFLVQEALALRDFRQSEQTIQSIRTQVVRAGDIWREFSGGRPEPAALRDFIRYARSIWPDLRFVLLAGDGHFDFRSLRSRTGINPLPPYQSEDISTDDFFQILDAGEEIHYGTYERDIAIGRLPVNTQEQFRIYLEKVRNHEDLQRRDNSDWRNVVLLSADDGFQRGVRDLVPGHLGQQENIASMLEIQSEERNFQMDIRRLYLSAYQANLSWQKPEATQDLLALINQGAVFTTYYGHGSSTDWADEGLLRPSGISQLSNPKRLTILGSFACTVGRFDEGDGSSLSELFLVQQLAGAIASIGAMRESLSNSNLQLGRSIMDMAYFDSTISTLGEALLKAKATAGNNYSSRRYNDERYVLLGEPVITLPRGSLSVNFAQEVDTLQALQRVSISGTVSGAQQGMVHLQVRQGSRQRVLSERIDTVIITETANMQGAVIYEERIPFTQGRFQTEFITPRKLEFGDSTAQIRAWAWVPGQRGEGRGLLKNIRIHGTSTYADSIVDTDAPIIKLRQCGLSGAQADNYLGRGQVIPLRIPGCLEVVITDSTGLDIRMEADEGISFEVPGVVAPWHPQPFLEQTGRRVVARMNFGAGYEAGDYKFRVRALDILGKVATREETVRLQGELTTGIADVFNAPNPMGHNGTVFYFKNLAEGEPSQATIRIFDQGGRLVRVLQNVRSGVTRWDGRDQWGRSLANGLYHYDLSMSVFSGNDLGRPRTWSVRQKLVISR